MTAYRENSLKSGETLGQELRRIKGSMITQQFLEETYGNLLNELRLASREGYHTFVFSKSINALMSWGRTSIDNEWVKHFAFSPIWLYLHARLKEEKDIVVSDDASGVVRISWE